MNGKKGIALAMETVVYIILAVLVLTVLLYFLTSQAGPVQNQAQLRQETAQHCSVVIQESRECKSAVIKTTEGRNAITALTDKCKKLGTPECGVGVDPDRCIQRCCEVYGCFVERT